MSDFANSAHKEYHVAFLGFGGFEEPLIDAAMRLSVRRNQPTLIRTGLESIHQANIVFIDDSFENEQHANFENEAWFKKKVIIRVDSDVNKFAHYHVKRPLQWNNLPYIVTIALEKFSTFKRDLKLAEATGIYTAVTEQMIKPEVKKILVVDDSETIRDHLVAIIKEKGLSSVAVGSVGEAMHAFQEDSFDCVLMDVVMPDVDGYEGCRMIKKLSSGKNSVPVIMLTSKASPFDKIKGKFAGCDAYLTKPTTINKLFGTIEQALNG